MNALSAFRSVAASVSRAQRPRVTSPVTQCTPGALGVAGLHSTRSLGKKKKGAFVTGEDEEEANANKKKIKIPEYNPTPKPRRGKKINIPYVRLLDPTTNTPGPLRPLQEILDSVDENEFYVELITAQPPVVKLVDVHESRLSTLLERQKSKRGAGQRDMHKEAQLTWTMSEGDERHKLQKVRDDLEKGYKVDVVYSPKKGTKPPPQIEMQFKLKEIAKRFEDIAKEWKTHEIDKRMGVLYLQSKVKVTTKVDREELKESIPKKVLEREQRKVKGFQKQQQNIPLEHTYKNLWES